MTPEQAQRLAGRTAGVRGNIVDPDEEQAESANADDNLRGIAWRRGGATADGGGMLVEGRLTVRYAPSYFINGERVGPFYRLRPGAGRPVREGDAVPCAARGGGAARAVQQVRGRRPDRSPVTGRSPP